MDADLILFLALTAFAMAIAGATALVIFWPLTLFDLLGLGAALLALVHVRDRHPAIADGFGPGAFLNPKALWWVLGGGYRASGDRSLSGLATPTRISLLVILFGVAMGGLLWVIGKGMA